MFEDVLEAKLVLSMLTGTVPSFGMTFAASKCKVMPQGVQSPNSSLAIQGERSEVVERFAYLASCSSCDSKVTDEISAQSVTLYGVNESATRKLEDWCSVVLRFFN